MRVVLAIAVGLACPLAAAAQPAGDRYGPASAQQVREANASAYQGRALSWASKQVAAPQAQQAYSAPVAAPPPAQSTLPPPPARYQPPPAAYTPFQPQVPLPLQQPQAAPARAVQGPPTSIYGAAEPAPRPAAPPRPVLAVTPAALARAPQPAPQPAAKAPAVPATAPAQPALQRLAQAGSQPSGTPRLYSVHRDFGMTPDVIEPTKGDRYVLIGPPDAPPAKSKTDDEDDAAPPGAF